MTLSLLNTLFIREYIYYLFPFLHTEGGGQMDSPAPMDLIEGHDAASSSQQEMDFEPSSSEACEKVIKVGNC